MLFAGGISWEKTTRNTTSSSGESCPDSLSASIPPKYNTTSNTIVERNSLTGDARYLFLTTRLRKRVNLSLAFPNWPFILSSALKAFTILRPESVSSTTESRRPRFSWLVNDVARKDLAIRPINQPLSGNNIIAISVNCMLVDIRNIKNINMVIGSLSNIVSEPIIETCISWTSFAILVRISPFLDSVK